MAIYLLNKLRRELAGLPCTVTSLNDLPPGAGVRSDSITLIFAEGATQTQRDQAAAIVAAHDPASPITDYAASHLANRRTFAKALYMLDEGTRNNTATLANIRTVLANTLTIIATLPAAYTDHFTKVRTLHSVASDPVTAAYTLAQCAELEDVINDWCLKRLAFAQLASEALD